MSVGVTTDQKQTNIFLIFLMSNLSVRLWVRKLSRLGLAGRLLW